jgi:hypothetical protein
MERASLTAGYGYVSTAYGQHWDITSKNAGFIDAVDIQEDGLVFSLIRWRTLGMDSSSQPRIKTKRGRTAGRTGTCLISGVAMPLKHRSLILSHIFSAGAAAREFGASNLGFCAKDHMTSLFQLETTHL